MTQIPKGSLWWISKVKEEWKKKKRLFPGGTTTRSALTSGTPIFLQASRKFSTFRRHLAMPSLGWKELYRREVKKLKEEGGFHRQHKQSKSYHGRRGNVDASHWTGVNVIGKVAEHNSIHQKRSQVLGEDELQSALDALRKREIKSLLKSCRLSTAATKHCKFLKKHKNGLNVIATTECYQMILRMEPGIKAHSCAVTESPSSLENTLQTGRCNVVWQSEHGLSYMSQLLHELQLLTQLFHLSSYGELRVSGLPTPVAPEQHWHVNNKAEGITQGQLHQSNVTCVSKKKPSSILEFRLAQQALKNVQIIFIYLLFSS